MKTSFRAYSSALWRPIRVVILGFIRNPQAVLLLAARPTPKSDRLLAGQDQRTCRPSHHATAAMKAEHGIVNTHASTSFPAMPQRTAETD
jgi:hypothetical protein